MIQECCRALLWPIQSCGSRWTWGSQWCGTHLFIPASARWTLYKYVPV